MTAVDSPLVGWGTPDQDQALEPLNVHSNVYEATRLVKSGPGVLYGFTVYSSKASSQFIQVFDSATAPASGAVPATVLTVGATSNVAANWIPGRTFLYGCWIVNSTTGPTYTAGLADCWFDVQFI